MGGTTLTVNGTGDLVESSRRRRLHLISGAVVFTLMYAIALLAVRNILP